MNSSWPACGSFTRRAARPTARPACTRSFRPRACRQAQSALRASCGRTDWWRGRANGLASRRPIRIMTIRSRRTCSPGSSTCTASPSIGYGWRTSRTSRRAKAYCIWRPCSIWGRGGVWAGRCGPRSTSSWHSVRGNCVWHSARRDDRHRD